MGQIRRVNWRVLAFYTSLREAEFKAMDNALNRLLEDRMMAGCVCLSWLDCPARRHWWYTALPQFSQEQEGVKFKVALCHKVQGHCELRELWSQL